MVKARSKTGETSALVITAYGLVGACAVAMFAVGGFFAGQAWAGASIAAGLLTVAVLGVAIALRSWITAVYGTALVLAAGLIAAGGVLADVRLIGPGILALAVVGAAVPIAAALRPRAASTSVDAPASDGLRPLLEQIHDHSMLSENAKRVLFRERELGLLREAIDTDIVQGKYDAALALCAEMANVFGYRQEAETFRARIEQAHQTHVEQAVAAALAKLDEHLAARDWPAVHGEAARIRRLYGESHLVQDLDQRILLAREEHKSELERTFLEAARRDDVGQAMNLLKQLDRYLAPEEAGRLTEVAQGVVSRHRENLGVQFKLAVNDHRWAEAAGIGEVIVDEFPNSKMADEVRSMIEVLRTRATQAALET